MNKHIIDMKQFENAKIREPVNVSCKTCGKIFQRIKRDIIVCERRGVLSTNCRECYLDASRVEKVAYITITCLQCGKTFKDRGQNLRKFCSQNCSGAYRHAQYVKSEIKQYCLHCKTPIYRKRGKYCSSKCHALARRQSQNQCNIILLKSGKMKDNQRPAMKKAMIAMGVKEQCNICGISEWRGQKMPLILDHMDGNSSNNDISNLQLICSNCDSILPHYKGKNKGFGRKSLSLL